MSILPTPLDQLLTLENVRLELKASWSEQTLEQVIRTISAFANDFQELNGGYIVIGIAENENYRPILPPKGLDTENMDAIQAQIRGQCRRIDPEYQPVLVPEIYQGKLILVIWCPSGDNRPYHAPIQLESKTKERAYYVRFGNETQQVRGDILTTLMQKTAKVPFDARKNQAYTIDVISPSLVRNYLSDSNSDLIHADLQEKDLYRALGIAAPINGHDVPKNIALLLFVDNPERYFPGARIEIVQFDDEGENLEERIITGPIHNQLRQALTYLDNFSTQMVKKNTGQAESQRSLAFPYDAMREALVNAVYHRSYEGMPEPTKVYLYPDRMEIVSYPGPMPGVEQRHFLPTEKVPPVPNRNRLIGQFLKDLKLAEGRGTGVPKIRRTMRNNGSPEPVFDFDETRSYFRVTLPAHPQYIVTHAIRENARLWAIGERQRAIHQLEETAERVPHSGALTAQVIEYKAGTGDVLGAEQVFKEAEANPLLNDKHLVYVAMARAWLDMQDIKRASDLLQRAPTATQADDLDVAELAILYKRAGDYTKAHSIFESSYERIKNDPKALHEYAQTKMTLAGQNKSKTIKDRLNRDAVELLRRAIQLSDSNIRTAHSYFDLARGLNWLSAPESEVMTAYEKAIVLLPNEKRFLDWYEQRKNRQKPH